MNHSNVKMMSKHYAFIDALLTRLGFDINKRSRMLNQQQLNENIDIITNDKLYLIKLANLNKQRHMFNDDISLKSKLGFLNSILKDAGVKISPHRKQEHKETKQTIIK